ncbi:MAG: iron-sulfur cluster assembly scaffold protein [Alphaproteobacteria bacterium]|nr:iron-sulfur cluster assembly scaffold protein [Alphaproteobacteria bacterium]
MTDDVYQDQVMELAKDDRLAGSLPDATASATVNNALCGDRVRIDLKVAAGRIAAVRHEVKGCLLCKASAAALAAAAIGKSVADLNALRQGVTRMLKEKAPPPPPPWAAFTPVADYKSRHTCVLLPFDALTKALGSG